MPITIIQGIMCNEKNHMDSIYLWSDEDMKERHRLLTSLEKCKESQVDFLMYQLIQLQKKYNMN